jgi:hypothetical protein
MKGLRIKLLVILCVLGASLWFFRHVEDDTFFLLEGTVSDDIALQLSRDWEHYIIDVNRPEQVYCIVGYRVSQAPSRVPAIHIEALGPASNVEATPFSVSYSCGAFPALHTHPPSDCTVHEIRRTWECTPSPIEETDLRCRPSDIDLQTVRKDEWHRFGVIQCDADQFVFFTP